MAPLEVLISGAGISGPVLGYWLTKQGMKATIVERAPSLRNAGQSVEVQGPSLDIVQKMGLEKEIRERGTHEEGLAFVDEKNQTYAELPMNAGGVKFTNEYEILRGDLVSIFHKASLPDVEYVFGDYITNIADNVSKVKINFAKGPPREFDILVIADGMNSRTRRLVFPDPAPVKGLGLVCCFFSIPWQERDRKWSRFYSCPGRQVLLRPHGPKGTAAHLGLDTAEAGNFKQMDDKERKELMRQKFAGVGWETSRVLAGMDEAEDFYMVEISQVKVKKFHKGRIVLLGDSAYCPSLFSGVGTTLAVVGAYVLAAELARNGTNIDLAFARYEAVMRPYVEKSQALPPGIPALACPKSQLGVRILRFIVWFLAEFKIVAFLGWLASLSGPGTVFKLPDYGL